ncbi:hypothetical protein CMI46_01320 [Candidatus Pacearchaeota archaeon]|nr:hypothetical protein [Candidatus Pacearchaeota archaeon]|tara:strand:+ start:11185 stop:12258 length:1074 start_codon:yes stop_codon:yes gene_type:complete
MTYFPESVVILSVDGIQFKTCGNQHPSDFIIARPKYIPTQEVFSNKFLLTNIFNKDFNRLNLWQNKEELKYYLASFKQNYSKYIHYSKDHKTWFFAVPKNLIKQFFDPNKGLKKLLSLPESKKDFHINNSLEFVEFLTKSGVSIDDLGITFSTLVGYHNSNHSDINVVIYGKDNAWKIINFLKTTKHSKLRWKTEGEWEEFRMKRNRKNLFTKDEFLKQMSRKRTEGFFNNTLFVLFPVEKEEEVWEKWGEEEFFPLGTAEIEGVVTNNFNSLIRPGYYEIKNSKTLNGKKVPIKKIVFYSRDYVMQALPKEKIRARGLLEKVVNKKTNKSYYRLVIGYFDSYLNERRGTEFIKTKW